MSTRWMPAAAALALTIAACGDTGASNEPASSAPVATTAPPPAVASTVPTMDAANTSGDSGTGADDIVVPASLQFTAPLVGGGQLNAADLADKPTVFWFWAPD